MYSATSNESTSRPNAGHCVWHKVCNTDSKGNSQNCPYNGTALPIDTAGQELLAKHCPHLLNDTGGGVLTCCDTEQLKIFDNSIALAANFLGRCPSCMSNLKRHICDFTCSPNQSDFMQVAEVKGPNVNGTKYITAVDIYVSNNYIEDTYQSCKQVSVPSTGQLALDLMCGPWAAARCSAKRWFTFMGTFDDGYVPFQRTYVNSSEPVNGFSPYEPPLTPCNKGLDVSIFR